MEKVANLQPAELQQFQFRAAGLALGASRELPNGDSLWNKLNDQLLDLLMVPPAPVLQPEHENALMKCQDPVVIEAVKKATQRIFSKDVKYDELEVAAMEAAELFIETEKEFDVFRKEVAPYLRQWCRRDGDSEEEGGKPFPAVPKAIAGEGPTKVGLPLQDPPRVGQEGEAYRSIADTIPKAREGKTQVGLSCHAAPAASAPASPALDEADELAEDSEPESDIDDSSSESVSNAASSNSEGETKVSLTSDVRLGELLFVTIRNVKRGIAARLFIEVKSGQCGKFVQLRTQKYTVESLRNEVALNQNKPANQVFLGRWANDNVQDLEPETNLGTFGQGFIVVGIAENEVIDRCYICETRHAHYTCDLCHERVCNTTCWSASKRCCFFCARTAGGGGASSSAG